MIIISLVGLSLVPFVHADTWENSTITVSVTDNEYVTKSIIRDIAITILDDREEFEKFAGWNNALNGTGIQFKLVAENGDIQINLVNHTSTKKYSAFTTFESKSPGIISAAEITIYEIEEISSHELQMLMRHELGHSLGLGHSRDSDDLMYPIVPYYTSYISQANIQSIESLYN